MNARFCPSIEREKSVHSSVCVGDYKHFKVDIFDWCVALCRCENQFCQQIRSLSLQERKKKTFVYMFETPMFLRGPKSVSQSRWGSMRLSPLFRFRLPNDFRLQIMCHAPAFIYVLKW